MITTLLGSIREYKKDSLLSPVFVTLEVIMEVLIPFMMSEMIDIGIGEGNLSYTIKIGIYLTLVAIMSLLFGALSGKYAAYASAGFAKNLRKDMFYNIQSFSFSNIDRFTSASLVTRLTTDVTNVQNAYQMIIRILIRGPIMLVFALLMSMTINMTLSLIFLCAIPILGIGLFLITIKAHPYFDKVFTRYDKLNSVVQENVTGVRVVKAYVREDFEISKFHNISKKVYEEFSKAERIIAFNSPLMQFCMYTSITLISWLGAQMIVSDTMTTGQMMSLIVYATQILSSLMMLSLVFVMIVMAETSAHRIVEVLQECSDLKNKKEPITEVSNGSIAFEHVSFQYTKDAEACALQDCNLQIKAGESIGILGGTGSAKTTLVQLIARLYDASEGVVRVGGCDVRDYDLDVLRNEVAMVLQNNVLFSGTIKENLRWGNAEASDEELQHACQLAQAHDFIQGFPEGYDTYIEQGGTNVSGGQKQRLCIARALLKKPKILILDDSTSAVDTRTDALIRKAFREELPGTTKIIIAQRISSIEDADSVIIMDKGQIQAMGTPQELEATNTIYQEVNASQTQGGESHEDNK